MTSYAAPRSLGEAAGLDLSSFRPSHVHDRVRRALLREGVGDEASLVKRLREDAEACRRFRLSVAVPVTGLFRDPEQFELLERELLPPLLERGGRLTVWSAGCADGSELVSLALLLERLGALERAFLLGSDLLDENVAQARAGGHGAELSPAFRARLRWEQRDLVADGPPAGKWTLILCRNVAIYLEPAAKARLHAHLAGSLAAHGVLLLGRSESILRPEALDLVRAGRHAYRKAA